MYGLTFRNVGWSLEKDFKKARHLGKMTEKEWVCDT